jgi:hypothetical protein
MPCGMFAFFFAEACNLARAISVCGCMRRVPVIAIALGLLAPTLHATAPPELRTDALIQTARDYALQALYDSASALLRAGYDAARQQHDSCSQARVGTELGRLLFARAMADGHVLPGRTALFEETRAAARSCGDPAVIAGAEALARTRETLGDDRRGETALSLLNRGLALRSRL